MSIWKDKMENPTTLGKPPTRHSGQLRTGVRSKSRNPVLRNAGLDPGSRLIGANLKLVSLVFGTWAAKDLSKSPFSKGGFRGIFKELTQNPP
jgi:hypothetical protein